MADKSNKSPAEIDREAVTKFNQILYEDLEREKRITKFQDYRGSKYPPMSIEPLPYERQRLSGPNAMMTPEDRALRKQWVLDQRLSPHEPIHVDELRPRNAFRRAYSRPWDILFDSLKPMMGAKATPWARYVFPKLLASLVVGWGVWYHFKYNMGDWTSKGGWHMYGAKPTVLPGDKYWPAGKPKSIEEFGSRGFTQRTQFLDPKTSMHE